MSHEPNAAGSRAAWYVTFRSWLDSLASVAVVVVCSLAVLSWASDGREPARSPRSPRTPTPPPTAPLPTEPISLEDVARQGSPTARVAMIVFSDFECPFSRRLAVNTLPELVRQHVATGDVQVAFVNLPLEQIHPRAFAAAEAAECARRQGAFWTVHDELFQARGPMDVALRDLQPARHGLDARVYSACIAGEAADRVREDLRLARQLGVTGTPTTFIGIVSGATVTVLHRISGVRPLADFQVALEEALEAAQGSD